MAEIKKFLSIYWLPILIIILVITADQATKIMVMQALNENEIVPVVERYLNLVYVRNQGAAFGILSDGGDWIQRYFFIPISLLASFAIIVMISRSHKDELTKITALSLILSGALGNMMDRLKWGSVVDFIDFHYGTLHWPAFNVADASISIGVILLITHLISDR